MQTLLLRPRGHARELRLRGLHRAAEEIVLALLVVAPALLRRLQGIAQGRHMGGAGVAEPVHRTGADERLQHPAVGTLQVDAPAEVDPSGPSSGSKPSTSKCGEYADLAFLC